MLGVCIEESYRCTHGTMVADSREKPLVKVMPWWVYVCLYGYAGRVWGVCILGVESCLLVGYSRLLCVPGGTPLADSRTQVVVVGVGMQVLFLCWLQWLWHDAGVKG